MMKNLLACSLAAAVFPFLVYAQPILKPTVGTADRNFLRQAAEVNISEVDLGQLAQEKAAAEPVKEYAQRMITDHTAAQHTLNILAARTNIVLPDQLDAKDMALYSRLAKLSGSDFDRDYINAMVQGHTAVVSDFKSQARNAADSEVRAFASHMLPTLEEHLKLAHQDAVQIGATSKR